MTRADLVSKRLAYIGRQKQLHAEGVNVDVAGRAPEGIEFLPRNQRGFWELRGYSNTAEPWFNDRYS